MRRLLKAKELGLPLGDHINHGRGLRKDAPMLTPQDFFDLNDFDHSEIFSKDEAVWTALDR